MNEDYVSQEDLDDAISEDTAHCQCCQASFVLGGNDNIYVEIPKAGGVVVLSLCIECAEAAYQAYRVSLFDAGLCQHGEALEKPCVECGAAVDLCKDILRFWGSHEAWGDYASVTRAAGAFAPIAERARKILEGQ